MLRPSEIIKQSKELTKLANDLNKKQDRLIRLSAVFNEMAVHPEYFDKLPGCKEFAQSLYSTIRELASCCPHCDGVGYTESEGECRGMTDHHQCSVCSPLRYFGVEDKE